MVFVTVVLLIAQTFCLGSPNSSSRKHQFKYITKEVIRPSDQAAKVGLDLCNPCVQFMGQAIQEIVDIILSKYAHNLYISTPYLPLMDRWMTCDFTSISIVFQSYQEDGRGSCKAVCNGTRFKVGTISASSGSRTARYVNANAIFEYYPLY